MYYQIQSFNTISIRLVIKLVEFSKTNCMNI